MYGVFDHSVFLSPQNANIEPQRNSLKTQVLVEEKALREGARNAPGRPPHGQTTQQPQLA